MCNPQPVNAGILLDYFFLISILGYYLGWCFVSNYEVIAVQECSYSLAMVMFLSQLKLYAIFLLMLFSTLEIMK